MKVLLVGLLAFLFSPELVVYTNTDYHFEVQFPNEHQIATQKQEEKFGSIEYIKLSGREGGAGYTVQATRYESNEAFKKRGGDFQELIRNNAKYLSEEFFIKNNFIILAENHSRHALEYVVGEGGTEMVMIRRIHIRTGMTYSLSIYCHNTFLKEKNVEPFFKSFKIKR